MNTIGIAGGTSVGKSTLAENLALLHPSSQIIHGDDHYKELGQIPKIIDGRYDLDTPDAYNLESLADQIEQSASHGNNELTIVEGLYVLSTERLRSLLRTKILLLGDFSMRMTRREDWKEKDKFYVDEIIKPNEDRIKEQKKYADLTLEVTPQMTPGDVCKIVQERLAL